MRVLHLFLLVPTAVAAQPGLLERIKQEVALIDQDTTLTVDELDVALAFGVHYDGGGLITYQYRGDRLVLIEEEVFPSYGRVLTQFYFHNDTLMLVRDREDDLPWLADSSAIDRTRLVKVFEVAYYMWTVDQDIEREQFGVRVLSEGPCGTLEWEPTVQRLVELAPRRQ
jgi:hypothetical protein